MSDPYLQRERMRYQHPVASREFILKVLEEARKPVRFHQILKKTNTPSAQGDALKKRLAAMVRDGQIKMIGGSSYVPLGKIVKLTGVVQRLRDGNVELVQEDESIIPVLGSDAVILLTADVVTYRKVKQGQKVFAAIVDIVSRAQKYLLGMVEYFPGRSYFISLQRGLPKMRIASVACQREEIGPLQIVKAEIAVSARTWSVVVKEIIGDALDADIPEIVAQHVSVLTKKMSKEVKKQVEALSKETEIVPSENRVDWMHLPLVTIDGASARDFDDAVMVERHEDGYLLYVAIADVSHYVPVDSPLDRYAYEQTTSIYFPKQCIPMLPEVLSNDLCSLLPNVPRYAMGVKIHLNSQGDIIGGDIARVVIRSKQRMTYELVEQMLDGQVEIPKWFNDSLQAMKSLTLLLQEVALSRRALNILSRQDNIAFNEQGNWESMVSKNALFSHGMIEKMMVMTNHFVAKKLLEEDVDGIYRHHPSVRAEGLHSLLREIKHAGIDSGEGHDLFSINEQIRQHDKYPWLASWVVRAMSQARYEHNLTEHWGLSLDAYVHFTSPIRRYPDLMVHRAIGGIIDGVDNPPLAPAKVEFAAKRCSRLERRADASVYDAIDWYQCQWVYQHLNQTYAGAVLSMLAFGIFVRLTDSSVEVLLPAHHLESLGFSFDYEQARWVHPRLEPMQLGLLIQVELVQVSFPLRRRDAMWVDVPKDIY